MPEMSPEQHAAVIAHVEICSSMVSGLVVALSVAKLLPPEVVHGVINSVEAGRRIAPDLLGRPYDQRDEAALFQQMRDFVDLGAGLKASPTPSEVRATFGVVDGGKEG